MSRFINVGGTICRTLKAAAELAGISVNKLRKRLRYKDTCVINGLQLKELYVDHASELDDVPQKETSGHLLKYPLGEQPLDRGLLNVRR